MSVVVLSGIEAVGFDLGETLMRYEGVPLNWQGLYQEALTAVWDACGPGDCSPSEDDLHRAGTVLARYNTRLNPRTEEVTATRILSEVLACWERKVDPDNHVSDEVVARAEAAFFGFFQQHYAVYDDTLPALRGLQMRGLKIGLLTDVPYGMSRRFVEQDLAPITSCIDVALTSVDVGHRKPAPQGFVALSAALRISADRMLYVGNEPKDIQGANAAGMVSVLLVREGTKHADLGQKVTISSLLELDTLIDTSGGNS